MKVNFKGVEYEIPIQNNWTITEVIDGTFSSGYVETTALTNDYGELDMSRRMPRGLLVKLERDSKTFYFKTGETTVNQVSFGDTPKYKHMINLISLERDLDMTPLENITITQPKGDYGIYTRSVNVLDSDDTYDFDYYVGVKDIYSKIQVYRPYIGDTFPFVNTLKTNASVIDGLEIVELQDYKISLELGMYNTSYLSDEEITVSIYYGALLLRQKTYTVNKTGFSLGKITPTYLDDTITFNYRAYSSNTISVKYSSNAFIYISKANVYISAIETTALPTTTYAQACDKILRQTNYVLSGSARNRLNLDCTEHKFEEYTVYGALEELANEVGAIVKAGDVTFRRYWRATSSTTEDYTGDSLGDFNAYDYELGTVVKIGNKYYVNTESEDVVREINFLFYDSPQVIDVPYNHKHQIAELGDFVNAVELNTKNVVKPLRYSPFKNGWKGVRTNGNGQQTTDNILYELEDEADRIISVKVKGLESRNASGTMIWTKDDVTDITEHVVNKLYYDTLSSEKDVTFSGKQVLRKHNCLYHEQGSRYIQGLTYLGEDLDQIVGNPNVIRAWVETILAVRSVEAGELVTRTGTQSEDDGGIDLDLDVKFQVTYANITQSRARVYKDDQSAFETDIIKYMNESANINESQAIGDYAQLIVNRLGGTKIVYKGIVDSIDELPNVGDVDSEGRVYTLIKYTFLNSKVKYEITAVQDYSIISSYIGVKSAQRNQEVSSTDMTLRTIRYTSKLVFTPTRETFTTRLIKSEDLLSSLFENTDLGLNYGYLECNHSNGETKKIHLSVDSDSKGKTIEIKWRLKDNYSAGIQRYTETIGGETVYLNRDVVYTDYYGKVNDIFLSLYYDTTTFTDSDYEAYPEALTNKGDGLVTTITDVIDKDAREILAGLIEIPVFSEDDEIRVYNGFARYNKVVEGSDDITTALLLYVPKKGSKLVDLSQVVDMAVTGTYGFGQFNFNFTAPQNGKGVVWYNKNTLELVLAYIGELTSGYHEVEKYYRIDDSLYGGGYNNVYNLTIEPVLEAVLNFVRGRELTNELSSSIGFASTLEFYRSKDIGYEIDNDIDFGATMSFMRGRELAYDLNNSIDFDATLSFYRSKDIGFNLSSNLGFNATLSYSVYNPVVEWVSGGTSPSGGTTCEVLADVGNVRCDSTCVWNETSGYISTTNETNIKPCSQGAEKTICVKDGAFWVCTVYEGDIEYTNCQTCELIEE